MFSVQNTSLNYGIFPLNAGDFHLFLFPVGPHVFLIITGIATIVAMLAAGNDHTSLYASHPSLPGLLLHLCIFHVYINVHDMTTYEYVRAQRQAADAERREALLMPNNSRPASDNDGGDQDQESESKCDCSISRTNKISPSDNSLKVTY